MIYYFLLLIVQILFGVNFVASKIVVTHWSAFGFACWRFLISGFIILVALKIMKKSIALNKKYWIKVCLLAFVGFTLSQSFFLYGLGLTSATNTSLISSTIPLFIFIINRLRGSSDWSKQKALGLVISFVGVLVLRKVENFSLQDQAMWGDLLVLLACCSLGAMISFSGDFFREVDPLVGTAHMFWIAGVLLIPLWLLVDPMWPAGVPSQFFPSLIFSVIGATCLTYLLNNIALKKVDSDIVGLFIFLQPLVAATLSYFVFDQEITIRMILSFAAIVMGITLVVRPRLVG